MKAAAEAIVCSGSTSKGNSPTPITASPETSGKNITLNERNERKNNVPAIAISSPVRISVELKMNAVLPTPRSLKW